MEPSITNLLSQFGAAGVAVYFLWLQIRDRFNDLKAQISDLKTRVDDCEQDREELWERLYERDPRPRPPRNNGSGTNSPTE